MMPAPQRESYNRMAVRITDLECMMRDAIAALYDAEMTETADELSERLKEEGVFPPEQHGDDCDCERCDERQQPDECWGEEP